MKKISVLIFIAALMICPLTVMSQKAKTYDVNFKNISMKEFITFVAAFTETNIVYNEPDLKGNVSIASQYPLKAANIMEIFYATLQSNGLSAIRENGYIRIVPDKDMPIFDEKFTLQQKLAGDDFVTTILLLDNYNATQLANNFSRVKSRHGNVEPLRGMNGLIIRDFGSRVSKMREIAAQMDKFVSGINLYTIPVENTAATKVEQAINKLFSGLNANALVGMMPVIIADDLSNVLVIAATENDFNKINYLISSIDVKTSSDSALPRVFYLRYARAEDVETVLNKLIIGSQPMPPPGVRMPVVKSSISSDKGTNSIIAIGDQELYTSLERMIEKLDIPRKQVYVEALILETTLNRSDAFGVEWFGAGANDRFAGYGSSSPSGRLGNTISSAAAGAFPIPGGFGAGLIGDVITYNGISFPSIAAFLSASRTDNGINIVSNPQILTMDNEEAETFSGQNIPFATGQKWDANNNPVQTVDYKNVGIRLKVTPHIAGESVNLDVDLAVDTALPSDDNYVTTSSRTTKTKVQLENNSIMVISGLMKNDSTLYTSGIPYLSSIPVLGWLFKSRITSADKTNLMVFISTRIINTREDATDLVERRTRGTSLFNERVNDMISNELRDKSPSFIPLQKDVDNMMRNTEKQE
ncbi:MAG: type II secretion system secretin GspD [Deferribacteraceae bacterium]|jgi:general secretion pathway protein D|nr:type II secretion system secretin GspD [Deferribacteraceae bacterium]